LCNAHARREFVEVIEQHPDVVPWVLERYGLIWHHDTYCHEHRFSAQQRLDHHRQHSLPVMEQLRDWGQTQLERDDHEAQSGLSKAIGYFLKHYDALTAFCRWPDAQIDNNEMERTLKLIIRGRKNALFFKTLAGAAIADVLTSLIATCEKIGINTFNSMIKFLPLDNVQSIIVYTAVMRPPIFSAPVLAPSARDRDAPYAYPTV
jgi:hypothetical protein